MDLERIKELVAYMEKVGLRRLCLREKDKEIELEREGASPMHYPPPSLHPVVHQAFTAPHAAAGQPTEDAGNFITSPMVGTFYASPSPENPAFVKVGDTVEEGTVVCIIEAMKVMNEVKAGVRGTVIEVLLKNGAAVEFGTKLFRVK